MKSIGAALAAITLALLPPVAEAGTDMDGLTDAQETVMRSILTSQTPL